MRLSHHAMIVDNMDRAVQLYCDHFGMQLLRRKPGSACKEVAILEDVQTGRRIEFLLEEGCSQTRFDHIAFEVEDVDQAFAHLKEQGSKQGRQPFYVPGAGVRTSLLRAPDGIKIELIRHAPRQGPGTTLP